MLVTDLIPYAGIYAGVYAIRTYSLPHLLVWALSAIILAQTISLAKYLRQVWVQYLNGLEQIPRIRSLVPFNLNIIYLGIKTQSRILPGAVTYPYFAHLRSNTLNMRPLAQDSLVTKDPLVIKHILTGNNFTNYGKGPKFKKAFNDFLGVGIFNSDPDDIWKFHRSLTKPFFSKERVTGFNLYHIDKMVNGLKNIPSTSPIDLQNVFRRLTFDASADFLFGYQNNALDQYFSGETSQDGFAPAFDSIGFNTLRAYILGSLRPVYELVFGSLTKSQLNTIDPLIDKIINEALERNKNHPATTSNNKHPEHEHQYVLDYLLAETNGDRKLVRDELLNLMLAGRDTTAALLTSLFVQFARHPEIYDRARQECLRLFGPDGEPDYQAMRDSRYLRAIINETLRMFPPVPTNTRYAFKDDVITSSDGRKFFVPGGSLFAYSLWWMQRDPKLWGDDAEEWDPDRWLDERIEKMTSNPLIFQPFSAGPRLCLGQQHAYNQATLVLIRMCQAFDKIVLAPDAQPDSLLLPTFQLTINWVGGAWMRLQQ